METDPLHCMDADHLVTYWCAKGKYNEGVINNFPFIFTQKSPLSQTDAMYQSPALERACIDSIISACNAFYLTDFLRRPLTDIFATFPHGVYSVSYTHLTLPTKRIV